MYSTIHLLEIMRLSAFKSPLIYPSSQSCGVSANEYSCAHRSPNKLWRSSSIFNYVSDSLERKLECHVIFFSMMKCTCTPTLGPGQLTGPTPTSPSFQVNYSSKTRIKRIRKRWSKIINLNIPGILLRPEQLASWDRMRDRQEDQLARLSLRIQLYKTSWACSQTSPED